MLPERTEDERPTHESVDVANVLAVDCSEAVLARCWAAAGRLDVRMRSCTLRMAPSIAAARRPLAIVVPNEVHAGNADELEALARDVRAITVQIDDEVSSRELEAMLAAVIRAATRRRQEAAARVSCPPPSLRADRAPLSAGRYALIHRAVDDADEAARETPRTPLLPASPDRPSRSGTRPSVNTAELALPMTTRGIRRG